MKPESKIRRPVLDRHARYRWDALRRQHQVVFPEGVLVLNESAAAILQLCDGRSLDELIAAVEQQFPNENSAADVSAFLDRLQTKRLLCDAKDS